MAIEKTLVLIKPDGVKRGLIGEVISRFEKAGMKITGMKMMQMTTEFAKKHYKAHVDKSFYKPLEKFMTSSPLVAMCIEGVEAIETVRKMVGSTEPKSAAPGTIRGDYAHMSYGHADGKGVAIANIVHASGDSKDAEYEVSLWFKKEELMSYRLDSEDNIL